MSEQTMSAPDDDGGWNPDGNDDTAVPGVEEDTAVGDADPDAFEVEDDGDDQDGEL